MTVNIPPNWVTVRGKCRIADTYKSIVEVVQQDVNAFNRMTEAQRAGRFFQCVKQNDNMIIQRAKQFSVQGTTKLDRDPVHVQDEMLLHHDDNMIIAERGGQSRVEIVPCWNEDTLTCDLYVDDRSYPLWHISQKILGEFLFE